MDRFVVGTGRCGSTLLSRMLSEHPDLLSLFEFFTGLDHTRRFATDPVDGPAFAALLAADQPVVTQALRRGYTAEEIVYPFGAAHARYTMDDELPWLLVTALSRMSDDPDRLFDETLAFARGLPTQALRDHYRSLFDHWTALHGRKAWLERSGSSIEYLGDLHALFPEARFLHIHRDGPEAALSMREHRLYRLAISFLFDLEGPPAGETGDPIAARLEQELPVEAYGRYWSRQLEQGLAHVPELVPGRWHAIAFEDLVARPREVLREVADFLELPGGEWLERGAGLVRGTPRARFPELTADEQRRLAQACASGRQLLGRSA